MSIRTFIDANVLIAAFRGTTPLAALAQAAIDDPQRKFVANDILRLELIPKPHYHGLTLEVDFYRAYFNALSHFVETTPQLVRDAETTAATYGLSAADALHAVAAHVAGVDEFITAEKPSKPIFRVPGFKITSLRT